MTVLAVGILALFAMFESGVRHLTRASTITTAGALADKEMEGYRAIKYASIGLPDSLVLAAGTPYSSDSAYSAHDESPDPDADGRGRQELSRRHVPDVADRGGGASRQARHRRRPRRHRHVEGVGAGGFGLRPLDGRVTR
jgi:hypothetical protein